VVWTAGVTNHPFLKANDFTLSNHGKVIVNDFLQAEPDIFIIGDNADTPYSGLAQTALYDGKYVASSLKRQAEDKTLRRYKSKKPIYVIPAGPGWAAVLWGKMQITGWVGWGIREAADFLGYKDYEPWWEATQRYLAKDNTEESCPLCFEE
jgi:NADH dehydrogenase